MRGLVGVEFVIPMREELSFCKSCKRVKFSPLIKKQEITYPKYYEWSNCDNCPK